MLQSFVYECYLGLVFERAPVVVFAVALLDILLREHHQGDQKFLPMRSNSVDSAAELLLMIGYYFDCSHDYKHFRQLH